MIAIEELTSTGWVEQWQQAEGFLSILEEFSSQLQTAQQWTTLPSSWRAMNAPSLGGVWTWCPLTGAAVSTSGIRIDDGDDDSGSSGRPEEEETRTKQLHSHPRLSVFQSVRGGWRWRGGRTSSITRRGTTPSPSAVGSKTHLSSLSTWQQRRDTPAVLNYHQKLQIDHLATVLNTLTWQMRPWFPSS